MSPTNGTVLSPSEAVPAGRDLLPASRLVFADAGVVGSRWDGAWWPRTRVLADELPELIAALPERYGRIVRVSYSMVFWDDEPRRLTVDGRLLRLGGFRTSDPYALSLLAASGEDRIDLLVVAPEAGAARTARVLDAVANGDPLVGGPELRTG
jgi:hypothetical protein